MVDRPGRMEGKVAFITGGASGLGKATAKLFVEEGGKVMIADINADGGQAVAAALGSSAAYTHLDVTNEASWIAALEDTKETFGGLHVMVQSAGIGLTKNVTEITLEEWRHVHAIDLDGVFLGCKHGIPLIDETINDAGSGSASGSIVNISSIAGVIAGHNMAAYNSAKAGVRHLSKSVALHCARKGMNIRCKPSRMNGKTSATQCQIISASLHTRIFGYWSECSITTI